MLTAPALSLTLLLLGQTSVPSTTKTLPPDWPPLPDFKTPVDYVKWFQDRINEGTSEEAGRLADELFEQADDSDAVKQAKRRAWGMDEDSSLDGLFTGDRPAPDHYAWDPKDHPDWERAYQANDRLRPKLLAFCRGKAAPAQISCGAPPPEFGFTQEDRVALMLLFPSRPSDRLATKVLIQNSWRAPGGKVAPERLLESFTASIQAAQHLERPTRTLIDCLVARGIRRFAYRTAIHALSEGAFGTLQMDATCRWLSRYDDRNLMHSHTHATEVAAAFDLLQYLYLSSPTASSQLPAADPDRVRKLQKYLRATHANRTLPDIESEIVRYDPRLAVQQVVDLYLATLDTTRRQPPQEAIAATDKLLRTFREDPAKHAALRQLVTDSQADRLLYIVTASEAHRRATRLLYALHLEHARTGRWPSQLRDVRSLPPLIRTDPFSRRDFVYRVEEGEPILYSVALNGQDDGGKHDRTWGWAPSQSDDGTPIITDSDYVFWPVQPDR